MCGNSTDESGNRGSSVTPLAKHDCGRSAPATGNLGAHAQAGPVVWVTFDRSVAQAPAVDDTRGEACGEYREREHKRDTGKHKARGTRRFVKTEGAEDKREGLWACSTGAFPGKPFKPNVLMMRPITSTAAVASNTIGYRVLG